MKAVCLQKYLIDKQDWDILIVLDACRYDYFAETYRKYFDGTLIPCVSAGSCTIEWLINTFTRFYKNTIYVSANPYVNAVHPIRYKRKWFYAPLHFQRVIEVWKNRWNDTLGTVHPLDTTIEGLRAFLRFEGMKIIIHYLQPHTPYITFATPIGYPSPRPERGLILKGIRNPYRNTALLHKLYDRVERYAESVIELISDLGHGIVWRIRELLKLPPADPLDAYRREYSIQDIRKAYKENLELAMSYVSMLIKSIMKARPVRAIITSDHGEFLGEMGAYGHWGGSKRSILRIVPWFEVISAKPPIIDPRFSIALRIINARYKQRPH